MNDIEKYVENKLSDLKISPPPKYTETFIDGLEFETKLPITSKKLIDDVLFIIKKLDIVKYEYRSETHSLHLLQNKKSGCIIKVNDINETWIKIKCDSNKLITKKLGIPIISRIGNKYKPNDNDYHEIKEQISNSPIFASFNKKCHNVYFVYLTFVFSLSFSLASNADGFLHQQMEFEYEGHLNGHHAPNSTIVPNLLEEFIKTNFPKFIKYFTNETKEAFLTTQYSSKLKSNE